MFLQCGLNIFHEHQIFGSLAKMHSHIIVRDNTYEACRFIDNKDCWGTTKAFE